MPNFYAYFFTSSPWEIAILLGVVLLLFSNRIPGMMRSLGRSVVEFKHGMKNDEDAADSNTSSGDKKIAVEK